MLSASRQKLNSEFIKQSKKVILSNKKSKDSESPVLINSEE